MKPSVRAKRPDGGIPWKYNKILPSSSTEKKPTRLHRLDSYRPVEKMTMTSDRIHDKYQVESPRCNDNINNWKPTSDWVHDNYEFSERSGNIENRKPDHYNGSAARPSRPTDSYKPSLRSDDHHRGGSRDFGSYRPSSRCADGRGDDGRYGINKPTAYTTLHDYILKKAFAAGISAASYYEIYYHCGEKAKEDKPHASAYWLLWRQECLIWKEFFPNEGFIGAEPKFKPTTADTETANFSLMSTRQLERTFRSSPEYGKLTQKSDPLPNSVAKGSLHCTRYPSTSSSASINTTKKGCLESSEYLAQAHLIESKARARNVPSERLMTLYNEKQELVKSHFPRESKEWHFWFVEATVWGHLFKDLPFPGREPQSGCAHRSRGKDGSSVLSYPPQEKVMEQMALRKGIRKEFFQFLNTARHDAIAVHPLCTCYARNFLADRLTWHQFFTEPFPIAGPQKDHSDSCRVKARPDPHFSQTQTKATLKPSNAKSEVGVLGPQRCTAVTRALAAPRPNNPSASAESQDLLSRPAVQSQAPATTLCPLVTQPHFSSNNARSHPAAFHFASSSPSTISTQVPAPSPNSEVQGNYVPDISIKTRPHPNQSQGPASANLEPREAFTQSAHVAVPVLPARGASEILPPPSILVALSDLRMSRKIPEGAVVMQNMDATVCNSDFVVQMHRSLQFEDATSIDSISSGLKCHFRYRGRLNGDLLLWIEPFTAGDISAFTGGHLFLRGWVQRILGFGFVALSFYWNEIRNIHSYKQTGTAQKLVSEVTSPLKADRKNNNSPSMTLDSVRDATGEKAATSAKDAVLMIRGNISENVSCSRADLKNLTFSFVIDSCKDKVEERLQCTFSLTEPEAYNKHCGRGLELIVKPFWGKGKDIWQRATQFVRAWALYAFQSTPCKASAFLASPEGLHILSKPSASLANTEVGNKYSGPGKRQEQCESPFNTFDLDVMLAEEAAKAEGCSRLVLDEVTGQVITVRELVKKTLYRASAKILGSSAATEDVENGYITITGTDGDTKDLCVEKPGVVDESIPFEFSGSKCQGSVDDVHGERAGKRVFVAVCGNDVPEKLADNDEQNKNRVLMGVDVEMKEITGGTGTKTAAFDGAAAVPLENGPRVVKASMATNGKRNAEEAEGEDRAGKKVCV